MLLRNELAYATRDQFPVAEGHTLIVPHRHTSDFFDLTPEEVVACYRLARQVRTELASGPHPPDGYTVGVNVGAAAGQGVWHVHLHVIPRRLGDVVEPRGGIRNLLPHRHP